MRMGRKREVSLTGLEVVVKQRQSTAWRAVRLAVATVLALLLLLLVFEFGPSCTSVGCINEHDGGNAFRRPSMALMKRSRV